MLGLALCSNFDMGRRILRRVPCVASELLFFDNEPPDTIGLRSATLQGLSPFQGLGVRKILYGQWGDVLRLFLVCTRPKHCSDAAELGATAVSFSCMELASSRAFVSQATVNSRGVVTVATFALLWFLSISRPHCGRSIG